MSEALELKVVHCLQRAYPKGRGQGKSMFQFNNYITSNMVLCYLGKTAHFIRESVHNLKQYRFT